MQHAGKEEPEPVDEVDGPGQPEARENGEARVDEHLPDIVHVPAPGKQSFSDQTLAILEREVLLAVTGVVKEDAPSVNRHGERSPIRRGHLKDVLALHVLRNQEVRRDPIECGAHKACRVIKVRSKFKAERKKGKSFTKDEQREAKEVVEALVRKIRELDQPEKPISCVDREVQPGDIGEVVKVVHHGEDDGATQDFVEVDHLAQS